MTRNNKRTYEMIARVLVFWTQYRDLIVKDSAPDQLFSQLDAVFQKLSMHATRQVGCEDTALLATGARLRARQNLVAQLETICGTAFGLGFDQFWMPRGRDDRAFVRAGRNFLSQLEPLKARFIEAHLPEDFIDKLKAAVQTLDEAIVKQTENKGTRVEATAAVQDALNEAFTLVKRMDPLLDNLLRDLAPVRAVWNSARRIEKAGTSTKPDDEKSPIPPPEATAQPQIAAIGSSA